MVYSFQLVRHANIRYREAVSRLGRCELLYMLRTFLPECQVSVEQIGGADFLTFECRELSPGELQFLSAHSGLVFFSAKEGELLRPLETMAESYLPEELPEMYISNFETIGKADLTRSGDNANVFAPGIPTVMEFAGTEDGLQLAGELVKAHGRLGIGGYHNDGPRSIDYKLWNFKAITTINCHERRIDYETTLCPRCLDLIDRGYWKFRGVTRVYAMEAFDRANEDMESHRDNFIKGAIRCSC